MNYSVKSRYTSACTMINIVQQQTFAESFSANTTEVTQTPAQYHRIKPAGQVCTPILPPAAIAYCFFEE